MKTTIIILSLAIAFAISGCSSSGPEGLAPSKEGAQKAQTAASQAGKPQVQTAPPMQRNPAYNADSKLGAKSGN